MWWGTGAGCPDKLWMTHPWKYSVLDGLWAGWSNGRGLELGIFKAPSNPNQFMILQ